MKAIPSRIQGHSPREMEISWSTGESFAVPYSELRFECPCAGCVDEHSGVRTLRRESIAQDIKAKGAEPIGRYALLIRWSDGHDTGMYHFDRLHEICEKQGRRLNA